MATDEPGHIDSSVWLGCRIHVGNAQWQQAGWCIHILVVGWCAVYIVWTEGPLYHSAI